VTSVVSEATEAAAPERRRLKVIPSAGDRVFLGLSRVGGLIVLAIMAGIGTFLLWRALRAFSIAKGSWFTTATWQPDAHRFGVAEVLTGTILIALIAVLVSVVLAIGTALFISEVAPRWLRAWLVSGIDLMAAVPSIVYGLWGKFWLQGHQVGVARWINTWFGWIPIFKVNGADPTNPLSSASVYTATTFVAGLVVAMMVLPIQCSIMREGFSRAPLGEREGAYALGSTRWGMVRSVVLPFGRGAMIGGTMLGLGRAMGETIAVLLIISPVPYVNFHILQTGAFSVSSLIALHYGEASPLGISALMAAGLTLFVLTLAVNFGASAIVARSRSGATSDG